MPPIEPTQDTSNNEHKDVQLHVVTSGDHGPASSMKKTPAILLALLLLVVVVGAFKFSSSTKTTTGGTAAIAIPPIANISVTSTGFVPATITVKVGQAVSWTNTDAADHLIASDPYPTDNALPTLNSKQDLSTHDSFSYIFNKAGTYTYHDDLNPYLLEGKVIVKQ